MTQEKIEEGYEQGIRDMVKKEQELGLEKVRQLSRYQGVTSLSRDQAMEIMSTIWPDAPQADKLAAAMLCASYGLNPLANHIFLIPFKDNSGKTTWSRVWGIRAKRLLATRRGTFSYLDMSPRLMTADEQIKVWGEVDKANLCYLSHLKDMKTGAEVYGYGKWPRDTQPKGTNKGNTQANMASIRSESQAIDRLRPAEMPSDFTITDEDYVEAEAVSPEQTTTLTFPRPASSTPDNATKQGIEAPTGREHWCSEHNTAYTEKKVGKKTWWSHPVEPDGWCNEDKPLHSVDKVAAEMAAEAPVVEICPEENINLDWLKESLATLNWQTSAFVAWLASRQEFKGLDLKGKVSEVVGRMSAQQAEFLTKEIETRLMRLKMV